ncbi:3-phosphoshikimate 1-carboxyvinyltransferase [Methanobacterium paludis]|uniref:3-phosphoshikimate 1-carboxyvinyltransferase n=1 Tax=Methanobacterium paludis (strain DSM 25820 / JCM 18151 / SWAN1) TaxID=868131 RepID=F6D6N9_METPW|nr:3-phosphoshikimate 1-carboxyvinyltransferase [Methanobacterium paludis]AEG18322.1 3-phosphoshikimate 1-carboxyvinyltransferase [Methanobacterium paludis]
MELTVQQAERIEGIVKAPPSKSYTHRAFIIAALAEGKSIIRDPLYSEDTNASLDACRAFGSEVQVDEDDGHCTIKGVGGQLKTPENVLNVKNSGTTLRIMTSVSALAPGYTVLTGDKSLRKRPMQDLLDSLKQLEVSAFSTRNNGMPPVIVKGGFKGGKTEIKGNVSSQFISSILIASPYAENAVNLHVKGKFISKPYVDMTLDIMRKFGVQAEYERSESSFHIEPQSYKKRNYTVEGDYSSASYIIAAAAALKSDVTIKNLLHDSKQGDKLIVDIVQDMGCDVKVKRDEVKISGHGKLKGVDVDLQNAPDLLPTVAALGSISHGKTRITGVEHARYKETDRIQTCASELSKLGVNVQEEKDGLLIEGGVHGGVVDSHMDHRLVMALYIIGLKVGNVTIKNASVYDVSFPKFPEIMKKLCRQENDTKKGY